MQALSFGLVGVFTIAAALVIALAILASPLLAAILFVIAFGAFLAWRGARRAQSERRDRSGAPADTPSTPDASADPVADSGVGVVAGKRRA